MNTDAAPLESLILTATKVPKKGLYIDLDFTLNGLALVAFDVISDSQVRIDIFFRTPTSVGVGSHLDSIAISVCYDELCARQVRGSPANVTVSYTVGDASEPNLPPLQVLDRIELGHDVIDAEYSDELEAVVMVSASPSSALHVLDPVTGARYAVALNKVPTSVSVSPDGQSAAVGHDALISHVDLAELVQTGATSLLHLNVSALVSDLVLDGRGFVHVFPGPAGAWTRLRSIEIATDTEIDVVRSVAGNSRGKLDPSGDYLYVVEPVSASNVEKYDVTLGTAEYLYGSTGYPSCQDLWVEESGQAIYTACGYTFRASGVQSEDLTDLGRLELSSPAYRYRISHLSQSDEMKETMLIEQTWNECTASPKPEECWTNVALYESDFLNRTAQYYIAPISFNGDLHRQRGLFVFHSADGARRYMISSLPQAPASPHYFSVLQ